MTRRAALAAGALLTTLAAALTITACSAQNETDWAPVGLISLTTTDRPAEGGGDEADAPLRVLGRATFGRTLAELPATDDVDAWTGGADACAIAEAGFGVPDPDDDASDGISADPVDALPEWAEEDFVLARAASGSDPVLLFRDVDLARDPDAAEPYLTLDPEDPELILAYHGERDDPDGMPADLVATADGALWFPTFAVGPFPVATPPSVTPTSGFGRDVRFEWTPDAGSGGDATLLLLTIEASAPLLGDDLACIVRDAAGSFALPEATRAELSDDWEGELTFVRRDAVRIVEVGRGPDAGPLLLVGAQERAVVPGDASGGDAAVRAAR